VILRLLIYLHGYIQVCEKMLRRKTCLILLMLIIVTGDVSAYVEVIGAGATAPSRVYLTWMAAYRSLRRQFVDVRLSYKAQGSGFGKAAIADGSVNYAGSDSLLSISDYEKHPSLQMFPVIALSVSSCFDFYFV